MPNPIYLTRDKCLHGDNCYVRWSPKAEPWINEHGFWQGGPDGAEDRVWESKQFEKDYDFHLNPGERVWVLFKIEVVPHA